MSIYAFGFGKNNISAQVLGRLQNADLKYQIFPNNIEHFTQILITENPEYILGMGLYSGIDKDKIRIETRCTNQFRNGPIDKFLPTSRSIEINNFVPMAAGFKYSKAMGNSYCNLVSYKIMQQIESKQISSKYSFLHIPNSHGYKISAKQIDNRLNAFV